MKRKIALTLLILFSCLLFFYPFLLISNIMGISAGFSFAEASLLNAVALIFMFFSSLYPLALSVGWIKWAMDKTKDRTIAAYFPIGHLILSVLLLLLWMLVAK